MNRPANFRKRLSTLATLLLLAPPLLHGAESGTDESSRDKPVNLLGSPSSSITPEYGLPVDAAEFSGNPASSLLSWLPEDLVIAPVPGYSPEFGWSLALLGGYFLDLDKPHPDTPPSIVGLLGWYAQNGSYAVGAGGRFNLLNDKERIGLAAGYGDANYRFYGIGDDAGDRGLATFDRLEAAVAPEDLLLCRRPPTVRLWMRNLWRIQTLALAFLRPAFG
jgi:hypothetical protein